MDTLYQVNTTTLRLRAEASTNSATLLFMNKGHAVNKIEGGLSDNWWKVKTYSRMTAFTGYVSHKYLTEESTSAEQASPQKKTTTKTADTVEKIGESTLAVGDITIKREALLELCPDAHHDILGPILGVINSLFSSSKIDENGLRVSEFLAQVATESGGLRSVTESLYYSASRLRVVWPHEFRNKATAEEYAGNPEKLANYIYGNRLGNGSPASGDGWRYRGRGLFQLTGRYNYEHYGKIIGMNLVDNPDQAADPAIALKIAVKYWTAEGLNAYADKSNTRHITHVINGGYLGLPRRTAYFKKGRSIWGVAS